MEYVLRSLGPIFFLIISVLLPYYAHAKEDLIPVPPGLHLKEIDTEHFRILYQASLESTVPYIADQCEQAFAQLSSIFQWHPQKRIAVLFTDTVDTHNGWSTVISHNVIGLYAAGSEQGSSVYQPGNYLKRTIYHELAHTLCMDMRYGYNRVFSQLFGKINPTSGDPLSLLMFYLSASSVALAPQWYLEGIAIWAETEFAAPGRGRSTLADMLFRCAVLNNNLLEYELWDLDLPYWPYDLGAYLYGMKLIRFTDRSSHTDGAIGALPQNLAHAFMFNFDSHTQKTNGMSFETLEQKMIDNEIRTQRDKILKLSRTQLTTVPRLTSRDTLAYQPRYIGERVYFVRHAEESRDTLCIYIPERNQVQPIKQVKMTAGFGSLSNSPDGRYIYYSRLEKINSRTYYSLRRFDTQKRKDSLVTNSGHYRSIDISPDGLKIAALSISAGTCTLIEKELAEIDDPHRGEIIVKGDFQEDISTPRYSSAGDCICYVKGNQDGFSLYIYHTTTKKSELVYSSQHTLLFPTWRRDNQGIIFSSDINGVYNLYEIRLDKPGIAIPITHVMGGVFSSDSSPDGTKIAVVAYDSDGYYLSIIPTNASFDKELPRITIEGEEVKSASEVINAAPVHGAGGLSQHTYSALAGLRFDYWSPWLTASAKGAIGGLEAAFSDPTGYQNLHVLGGMESRYGTRIGSLEYLYSGFLPSLHLFIHQEQAFYPNLIKTSEHDFYDYAETLLTLGIAVERPLIQKMDRDLTLQVGYRYMHRDPIHESTQAYEDKTIEPIDLHAEPEGSAWLKLGFTNAAIFGRSCSLEDGRIIALMAEKTDAHLGGRISRSRYLGQWNEYLSNPLAKNHVLKLSCTYGYGTGDRSAEGLFGIGGIYTPLAPPGLGRSFPLRGYEENVQTGDQIAKITCAYRFPILDIFKAETGSMPVYYRQLFAEIFYDGGMAWSTGAGENDRIWLDSVGIEFNFSIRLLRFLELAPGIGIVYALDQSHYGDDDDHAKQYQLYLSIKGFVNE
jgi:Tol biopolymer transport system component